MSYNGVTDVFRRRVLEGWHNFNVDQFKLALYTIPLPRETTDYTTGGETSGFGYTAGGQIITVASGYPTISDGNAIVYFDPVTWTSASFKATHGLIYNSTNGTDAVLILDFGGEFMGAGEFTVNFPLTAPPPIKV